MARPPPALSLNPVERSSSCIRGRRRRQDTTKGDLKRKANKQTREKKIRSLNPSRLHTQSVYGGEKE